jgi:uncharacterized protein
VSVANEAAGSPTDRAEPALGDRSPWQCPGDTKAKRRRRLRKLAAVLVGWTLLSHITVAMAASELATRLRLVGAARWGIAVALLMCLPLRGAILAMIEDRPRSAIRVRLLELPYFAHWCAASIAGAWTAGAAIVWMVVRARLHHPPFSMSQLALYGYCGGLAISLWGVFVARSLIAVTHLSVGIRGLGLALQGYRIVHLSDLHMGSFVSRRMATRWMQVANRQCADLVVITGDLATRGVRFHSEIVGMVGALKARDGVVVVAGNHDDWTDGQHGLAGLKACGVRVLRNSHCSIRRNGAALVIAGVDDALSGRADLNRALARRPQNVPTVLLAHDPDLFPHAAHANVQLVLSGHTHGGQIAVPLLARWLNLSRFSHRFHRGLYRAGICTLYVNRGLGTTGPPIRLGATPEITVVELHATSKVQA